MHGGGWSPPVGECEERRRGREGKGEEGDRVDIQHRQIDDNT